MSPYASPTEDAFNRSLEVFEMAVADLGGDIVAAKTHAEVEDLVTEHSRKIARSFMQDHFDLRAIRETVHVDVVDFEEVERSRVESGRKRQLATVHGEVTVERHAYRERGGFDLHVADATANLPLEKHSHGLRRLAAIESCRGSFDEAGEAIERTTGVRVAKQQIKKLAGRANQDIDEFYDRSKGAKTAAGDVIVLSADGKGIVMRPDGLRESTQRAAANTKNKLTTRLSRGEKRNRKRMAEVGAVYTITPLTRAPSDVITTGQERDPGHERRLGPQCHDKWLMASVKHDIGEVIGSVFQEADSRDPRHCRQRIALVDGNAHQIDCIAAQAAERDIEVPIIVDFVHVLEYLGRQPWCFFPEGSHDAENWVAEQALAVLDGKARTVAAAIRRKATANGLTDKKRKGADTCADYLQAKAPYLDYPRALSSGWPIATGIIEGACRHLVKDRMDITGARWGLDGAEAILKLRAVINNGDFNDYWTFHVEQEHDRVHRSRYLDGHIPGELDQAA